MLTKILLISHIFVTNIWRISHILLTNKVGEIVFVSLLMIWSLNLVCCKVEFLVIFFCYIEKYFTFAYNKFIVFALLKS